MIFPCSLSLSFKSWRAYSSAGIPCYSTVHMQCIQCKIFVSICIISPIISFYSATCLFSILSIGASPPAAQAATGLPDIAPGPRSSPPCPLPLNSTPLSLQHATKASYLLSTRAGCLHQTAIVRTTGHITKGHAAVHPYAAPGVGKKANGTLPPSPVSTCGPLEVLMPHILESLRQDFDESVFAEAILVAVWWWREGTRNWGGVV